MTRTRQHPPRKNRRFIAVFATLAVFAGLVAVTQVSLAGSRGRHNNDGLPACPPSSAAAAPATAAHDHSNEQDPDATPPPGAPAGEVAGAAGDGSDPAAAGEDATDATEAPAAKVKATEATAADAQAAEAKAANRSQQQRGRGNNNQQNCRPTTGTGGGSNGGSNSGGSGSTPSTGTSGGTSTSGPTTSPTTSASPAAPLVPLARNCDDSDLQDHTGFQEGPRCVTTEMGEVSAVDNNPTLLISRAPARVRANAPFDIQVSTRNLVRDRFLGAAAGGYYLESAKLTEDGLTRGHFHVACRLLSGRGAQDPAPVPAFFKAVEDGGGGAAPDTVTVTVPGLAAAGVAQCAAWAGDGSHRIPMMVRANEIPAFDSVRVVVTR